MELNQFIRESLIQIAMGVRDAQLALNETGAIVAPQLTRKNENSYSVQNNEFGKQEVNEVKFRVALTVNEKDGVKGGIGVLTGLFSAGARLNSESIYQNLSSIEFSIPIVLPPGDVSSSPQPRKFAVSLE